jgi:hypothetical protein
MPTLSLNDRLSLLEADFKVTRRHSSWPGNYHSLSFGMIRICLKKANGRFEMRSRGLSTRVENATRKKVRLLSLADLFSRSIRDSEGVEAVVARA